MDLKLKYGLVPFSSVCNNIQKNVVVIAMGITYNLVLPHVSQSCHE